MRQITTSASVAVLFVAAIFFYPMGIYVANVYPWNHIFLLLALLSSIGAIFAWYIDSSKRRNKDV
jgi:hypothetical protein